MDAIARVLVAGVEVESSRSERIVRPAFHAACMFCRLRIAGNHFGGRRPGGPFRGTSDADDTCPAEAFAADPDAIADRLEPRLHEVEIVLVAVDYDRSRLLGGPETHDLPPERFRHSLVCR